MAGQRLTDKIALEQNTASDDKLMIVDTSDTTGSSAGTSKKIDAKYIIQTDKISVSNAEFLAMDATGGAGTFKTLVAAPGSGFSIIPLSVLAQVTYASSTDTANKTLYCGYASNTIYYWGQKQRFMYAQVADRVYRINYSFSVTAVAPNLIDNKPFILYSSGNFNGGFSADIYVTYQIVAT